MNTTLQRALELTSYTEDKDTVREIMQILCRQELSVDRASRVLSDARKMLPYVAKLNPRS